MARQGLMATQVIIFYIKELYINLPRAYSLMIYILNMYPLGYQNQ